MDVGNYIFFFESLRVGYVHILEYFSDVVVFVKLVQRRSKSEGIDFFQEFIFNLRKLFIFIKGDKVV